MVIDLLDTLPILGHLPYCPSLSAQTANQGGGVVSVAHNQTPV